MKGKQLVWILCQTYEGNIPSDKTVHSEFGDRRRFPDDRISLYPSNRSSKNEWKTINFRSENIYFCVEIKTQIRRNNEDGKMRKSIC